MRAVAAARAAEGLQHDGLILQVSKVELMQAKQFEDAAGGTLPLLLVSAQVQYIHTVRNSKVRNPCARARTTLPSHSKAFLCASSRKRMTGSFMKCDTMNGG